MIIVDESDAMAEFARLTQADTCPTLGAEEQIDILARFKRAELWVASTAYELGAVVIPTLANRNGHRYKLVSYTTTATDQKSGAAEPNWSTTREARVTDNHVTWEEDGGDWGAVLWDFTAAAHEGWLVKMGKASPSSDFETDAMAVKSSQLFDHCKEMAESFQPVFCL